MKPLRTAGIATAGATVLAPISWGTTYTVVTETLPAGRPLLVAAARVVPAGLALVAGGTLASRWRPRGAEWARTAVLALFNFGLFFPLLTVAVYRLPGGIAAAAGGLQPLLVATGSWPATGHRPRARDLAVGLAAALGVALVVIRPGAGLDPAGVLAAVAANVSFAAGVVLTRRLPAPAPAHRLAATGWQLLLGGVLLVPLALAAEGRPPALTGGNVVGFAYLSLVGTALAFLLWFEGIRRLPAAAPPLLGLAAPVTGALLGWVILRQSLSPVQLAGFVLTLGAIAYGALLGASAAVGDDARREQRDAVAHPVGDDQCTAAPEAEDDGLVSSCPQEVDRPNTTPSAGNVSHSSVSCSRGGAAPMTRRSGRTRRRLSPRGPGLRRAGFTLT